MVPFKFPTRVPKADLLIQHLAVGRKVAEPNFCNRNKASHLEFSKSREDSCNWLPATGKENGERHLRHLSTSLRKTSWASLGRATSKACKGNEHSRLLEMNGTQWDPGRWLSKHALAGRQVCRTVVPVPGCRGGQRFRLVTFFVEPSPYIKYCTLKGG